jgi:quercetin dioxygenase-like cupin family protein
VAPALELRRAYYRPALRGHPARPSALPAPGGLRFNLYTVPPASAGRPQTLPPEAERELEEALPGRAAHMESDQGGMHRTSSPDFILVVSGEIWLELDNEEVHLREGDCVVQNGSRHAWRNKGDKSCTMAIILVGAGMP